MSDDLIKRMREGVTWDDAVAAIDRIEQSEREQDECFELSVHWRKEADFLAEQRREAQAKLAKALEALREIITRWDTPTWKEAEATGIVINRARTALAELERESE